jgi:hypothetical protein
VFPDILAVRIQLTVRLPKELMICQVTASAFPVTYVSPRELPATPGSRLVDGQRNGERCSGSGPAAARGDVTTVGVHESFSDGKSNSCTAVFTVAGSIDSVEAFEHVREVLGGYPVASVGDRNR